MTTNNRPPTRTVRLKGVEVVGQQREPLGDVGDSEVGEAIGVDTNRLHRGGEGRLLCTGGQRELHDAVPVLGHVGGEDLDDCVGRPELGRGPRCPDLAVPSWFTATNGT